MQKKIFAAVLLVWLLAAPFMFKIPATKANYSETLNVNLTVNHDTGASQSIYFAQEMPQFTAFIDFSNATIDNNYQSVFQIYNEINYGWALITYYNGSQAQLTFFDNWDGTGGSLSVTIPMPKNVTIQFDGTNIWFKAENGYNDEYQSPSCSYVTVANPTAVFSYNPTNSNNQNSGTLEITITNNYVEPTPSPSPSSSSSPSSSPSPTSRAVGGEGFANPSPNPINPNPSNPAPTPTQVSPSHSPVPQPSLNNGVLLFIVLVAVAVAVVMFMARKR